MDTLVRQLRCASLTRALAILLTRNPGAQTLYTSGYWIGLPVFTVILLALLFLNRAKFYTADQDYVSILMPPFWAAVQWTVDDYWLEVSVPRFYSLRCFISGKRGTFLKAWRHYRDRIVIRRDGVVCVASGGLTLHRYFAEPDSAGNPPMSDDPRSLRGVDRLIHEPSRCNILASWLPWRNANFLTPTRDGLTKGISPSISRNWKRRLY